MPPPQEGDIHQPEHDPLSPRERSRSIARKLEETNGIKFYQVPNTLYPGMEFTTPGELVDSQFTQYDRTTIVNWARGKKIDSFNFGGNWFVTALGARQLKSIEERNLASPSNRQKPRKGHPRQT